MSEGGEGLAGPGGMGFDEEPAFGGGSGRGQGVATEVGLRCAAGLRSIPDAVSVHTTSRYCCHFNYQDPLTARRTRDRRLMHTTASRPRVDDLLGDDDCLGEEAADQY